MEGERSETRKNNVCENSEVIENSVFGLPIWSLPLVSPQLLGNLEGKYLSSSGRTKERNEEERSPSWDKDNVRTSYDTLPVGISSSFVSTFSYLHVSTVGF
ncbi:hypothetical protein HZH66_002008 [Vespula vulgaris]|uniref:Uncharacterized protein n=1 Tax=Vespula vulgaris TaxID=7454 RepID=A0A834KKB4_VESVU|nr:hypothetical protein HZH66_002008 [Vespula vulgaris]